MDPTGGGPAFGVGAPQVGPLGEYLRDQRRAARLTLRQLAERAEVSNPYLSQVERGLRQPSAHVLNQIARGLRISAHALYVRAGLLADELLPEEHPTAAGSSTAAGSPTVAGPPTASGQPAVRIAVEHDPHLLDRHKSLLLDLYETFRRDAAAEPRLPATTAPADHRRSAQTVTMREQRS